MHAAIVTGAGPALLAVKKAGYSVAEEVPVFLVVFAVPALVALFLVWRFR